MPTKLSYSKNINHKNAKRKISKKAIVKIKDDGTIVTVKKGTNRNVKDSETRK